MSKRSPPRKVYAVWDRSLGRLDSAVYTNRKMAVLRERFIAGRERAPRGRFVVTEFWIAIGQSAAKKSLGGEA